MNIIEAFRSKKSVRRKDWSKSITCRVDSCSLRILFEGLSASAGMKIDEGDILADDWEIEEKKITISEEQLKLMAERLCDSFMFVNNDSLRRSELFTFFKKELGF